MVLRANTSTMWQWPSTPTVSIQYHQLHQRSIFSLGCNRKQECATYWYSNLTPLNCENPVNYNTPNSLNIEIQSVAMETEQTCAYVKPVVVNSIKLDLQENPESFEGALSKFCSTYRSLKTQASRVSALYNFGRQSYLPLRAKKRSTTIPVQPTAIARRKSNIKGRRCLQSGRPAKKNYSAEHGYAKGKSKLVSSSKAPHNLSECVARNYNVGKKHWINVAFESDRPYINLYFV